MKISGTSSTGSISSAKSKSAKKAGGQSFSVDTQTQTQAAVNTQGASSIQSVDAILALQSVGDFTEARKRATERAFDMLDVLDELKLALLEGGLPRAKLEALMFQIFLFLVLGIGYFLWS